MDGIAHSTDEMIALGHAATASAQPGQCIALIGGLGAGKTHWTKGFVTGIGSSAEVTSPTFSLLHEYHGGRIPVYHFDFYRLESAEELLALGWDEITEAGGIVIAEWADRFPELLPPDTRWLRITPSPDGTRRLVTIPAPSGL